MSGKEEEAARTLVGARRFQPSHHQIINTPHHAAVCFTVPPACLLTASLASPSHPHYGTAFDALDLPDRDALCLALLTELCLGGASAWAPYIAALPSAYTDPTWWSEEDAGLLAGSRAGASADAAWAHVLRLAAAAGALEAGRAAAGLGPGPLADTAVAGIDPATRARLHAVASTHGWSAPATPPPFGLSPAGAAWARSTVWSRAFNLPPVGSMRAALVPVVDLLDHDPGVSVAWSVVEDKEARSGGGAGDPDASPSPSFRWVAVGPVPAGSPLQMNYSPHKSNEELMCGYGFTIPANAADFFHVSLGLGGEGADRVGCLLRAAGLPRDCYMRARDPLPASALAAAVVALSPQPAQARLEAALVWGGGHGEEVEKGAVEAPPPSLQPTISVGPAPPAPPAPPPRPRCRATSDVGVPASVATQLTALTALRGDLRARAGKLGGGGRDGKAPSASSLAAAAAAGEAAAAAAAAAGNHHAAMALAYIAGQRRLAGAALKALEARTAGVVAAAAEAAADCGLLGDGGDPPGTAPTADWGVQPASGVREVGAHPPAARWAWGLALPSHQRTPRGATLLTVPAAAVTLYPSPDAAGQQVALVARCVDGGEESPRPDLSGQAWAHLMRAVGFTGGGRDGRRPEEQAAALARLVCDATWPVGPGSTRVALLPLAWCVPPALRGLAVDLEWEGEPGHSTARLVAACDLAAGAVLCRALAVPGALADEVVSEFGPGVLDAVGGATLDATLGGPAPFLCAVPLWVSPAGEGDGEGPGRRPASAALAALGLAGPHWLSAEGAAGQVAGLTAALVVMASNPAAREAAGLGGVMRARAAAAAAWAAARNAGGAGRDDAAAADARADGMAVTFIAAILAASGSVRRSAAHAAASLIQGELDALAEGGDEEEAPAVAAALRPDRVQALQACYGAAVERLERERAEKQRQRQKKKQRREAGTSCQK